MLVVVVVVVVVLVVVGGGVVCTLKAIMGAEEGDFTSVHPELGRCCSSKIGALLFADPLRSTTDEMVDRKIHTAVTAMLGHAHITAEMVTTCISALVEELSVFLFCLFWCWCW